MLWKSFANLRTIFFYGELVFSISLKLYFKSIAALKMFYSNFTIYFYMYVCIVMVSTVPYHLLQRRSLNDLLCFLQNMLRQLQTNTKNVTKNITIDARTKASVVVWSYENVGSSLWSCGSNWKSTSTWVPFGGGQGCCTIISWCCTCEIRKM